MDLIFITILLAYVFYDEESMRYVFGKKNGKQNSKYPFKNKTMNAAILNLKKEESRLKTERNNLKYNADKEDELFPMHFEKVDQQLSNVQLSLRKEFDKLYRKN